MKVLIVDDHPLMRDGVRGALAAAISGADIREAGSGAEALKLATATDFGLAVLDVHLPGMNGLELARHLRAYKRAPIVVMLAGEADAWSVNEAFAAGASGYVVKTNAATCLREAVRVVLRGGRFLCPDAAVAVDGGDGHAGAGRQAPVPAILSARELDVLKHIARGETTRAIAADLGVSPKTIETHRRNLMLKLGIDNPAALARYAIRHGLIVA